MRTCVSTCLRILLVFSVALSSTAARAQTEPPVVNPGSPQQGSTSSNCANGDLSACGPTSPSADSTSSGEGGLGSSWSLPNMSPGAPNAPMSVYRDDADGIDRTPALRQ